MTKRQTNERGPRAVEPARKPAGEIRIVLADHHAIDRGGLVGLIERERDLRVVGEAASLDEALLQCRTLAPDVLVLTLTLPDQTKAPAIPWLLEKLPQLRILALSDRGAAECVVLNPPSRRRLAPPPVPPVPHCPIGTDCLALAAAQGARATVRRDADPEELYRGIRSAAAGQTWFDVQTTTNRARAVTGATDPGLELSERELDVAALLAEGFSNKEISTALKISEPTAKKHIGHILEKLGLQDRLQAGLYVARHPLMLERRPATSRGRGAHARP